jgi:carbon monoxide dehydrogenase subunit G
MKFESTTEINASPEAIWAALSHPEEWPQWIASIKKIEKLSTDSLGVGSRLHITARAGIISIKLLMTITEFVPRQRVVMQGNVLGTRLSRYYTLEPVDHQTRVTAGGESSGLLSCLVSRGGQALSNEIVHAFKKKIEG